MTVAPDSWEAVFAAAQTIPGSTRQQPAQKTVQALQDEAQRQRRSYAADIAVSMGAVDTGDDFDPYEYLADQASDNADAIDGLDTRVTSLEGADADVAAVTHAASSKATPVDADELALVDSAASNVLKKLTWANLKTAIGSWYDSATRTLLNKTLTDPVIGRIKDANGNVAMDFVAVASAVNYVRAYNAAAAGTPKLVAAGSDTDVNISVEPKGSGKFQLYATTGNTPTVQAQGQDSNVDLQLRSKGTGTIRSWQESGNAGWDINGADTDVGFNFELQAAGRLCENGVPVVTRQSSVPSSASDTGTAGSIAFDGSYLYLCTATDTWVRAAVATW